MLRSRVVIRMGWACLLACLLALVFAHSPAFAKKSKRPDPAATLTAEPAAAPDTVSAGPARFFRIQDVLEAAGGKDLRIAALGDTQSDAIGLRGTIASLTGTEPFGLFAFRAPEGILWQKWRGLEAEFEAEQHAVARCREHETQCTPAARRLVALIDTLKERDGRARLDAVNRAVNEAIRYQSDAQQFGEADRWLSPLAAFTSRLGDCEDYVIAKYFALREAGFPLVDLRFVLVRDRKARDDHAVLAARDDGHWLILDNRHHALDHDTSLAHLTPLFAINHDGVKLVAAPYLKPQAAADAAPAPWLEGDEFALRGSVAIEPANGGGDAANWPPF
jgi:predicted transglutaminase-like cysteine proteinase